MILKDCPFCGGTPVGKEELEYGHGGGPSNFYIQCSSCYSAGKSFSEGYDGDKESCRVQAAKAWNKRV